MHNQIKKVVVAGTGFGRIYLEALTSTALSAQHNFQLVGIMAKGSEYSRRCAEEHQVPLYTAETQIPDDVDMVCLVLRSGAIGGEGSEIAQSLLRRGIHVLQEHPVHSKEIAANLVAAKQGNAAYAVNTLYHNLRHSRQLLAVAEYLNQQHLLAEIEAVCNSQMAYPLLDLIGRAVGKLRPWSFSEPTPIEGHPYQVITGHIGSVPLTLKIQNQVHPDDPDNHSFLLHKLSLSYESGVLSLADTHGPVLWNPRLHSPRDDTGRLVLKGVGTERLAAPSMVTLGDKEARSFHQVFALTWPEAILQALHSLNLDIEHADRRKHSGQWALGVTMAWSDLTKNIGMPTLISPPEPASISIETLIDIAAKACQYDEKN